MDALQIISDARILQQVLFSMPSLKDNVQILLDCILRNPKQAIATWKSNPEINYLANEFAKIDIVEANQLGEKVQITEHLQNFIDDAKRGKYTDKPQQLANVLNEVRRQIFQALDTKPAIDYVPSDSQDSQIRQPISPESSNLKILNVNTDSQIKQKHPVIHELDFHKKNTDQIPTYMVNPTLSTRLQSPVSISQNLSFQKQSKSKQKKTIQVKGSQLKVTIKYLETKLNINYQMSRKQIKKHLDDYVEMYLKKTQIQVLHPKSTLSIMDDTVYMKSADCGNYSFDPFCDCIQFYISRIDQQPINNSFRVIGERPDICMEAVADEKQWGKSSNLQGTDKIDQLLKLLCEKKQQNQQTYQRVLDNFRGHSVKLIRDLFQWQRQHYQQMRLKLTWVFQMTEIVQRIRDQSGKQVGSHKKKIKKQKQQCMKNANSHKILRYLIYKVYGEDQLAKVPKISYENLKNAISIVKEEIINDELLNNLEEYFYQFTHVPKEGQKAPGCSRGLVLFGPPGTGKTELTQALPDLIGFHLISVGLSAADFMKSLVGQSSRMIKDLVNRANLSSHLICSVGIDEVDGLVPDRKDKQQKNKGQGISMLLSVIGGNKDVPNLLFLTSTNHLKKIDQAIRRRLSGQFQVGRPNPEARRKVMEDDLTFLKRDTDMSNFLVKITSNFTGAALKRLNAVLLMKISKKRVEKKPQRLTKQQIAQGTNQIAKQFSITLGMSTFPQIYQQKTNKKFIFSLKFLNKIAKRFLLVFNQNAAYQINYANQMQKYQFQNGQNKLVKYYELFQELIVIDSFDQKLSNFQIFKKWIQKSLQNQVIVCEDQTSTQQIFERKQNKPTLGLIRDKDRKSNSFDTLFLFKFFDNPPSNLYIIYYVQKSIDFEHIYKRLKWKQIKQKPYSGRVMIELNEEPRMAFELNTPQGDETKFSFRHFMKTQKQNSPNDVIPQLVQFFTQRKVSYILLIEYQLILQNAAYDGNKMLEIIQQKMGEAVNYDKVAVIINADSLIVLNESVSDSSMGRSTSYSVSDQNMYRLLLNYMKQFALISKKIKKITKENEFNIEQTQLRQKESEQKVRAVEKQKWMAVIVKNPELAKILKKDLNWPKTPQQRKQQKEQQQMEKKQKICYRCKLRYTEAENQKQRKCVQHPGPLIDLRTKQIEQQMTITKARFEEMKYKKQQGDKKDKLENLYIFACCGRGVNQQGEGTYFHITKKQFENGKDQLTIEREQRQDEWNQACEYL